MVHVIAIVPYNISNSIYSNYRLFKHAKPIHSWKIILKDENWKTNFFCFTLKMSLSTFLSRYRITLFWREAIFNYFFPLRRIHQGIREMESEDLAYNESQLYCLLVLSPWIGCLSFNILNAFNLPHKAEWAVWQNEICISILYTIKP